MNNENTSLAEIAYKKLREAIIMGKYPPGYQIVELTIATQFNMSRSPVRIAITRLQTEGIIEKQKNKRFYVAHANRKRTIDTLYIREVLEGLAARLAAMNRTEKDIEILEKCMEQMNTFNQEKKQKDLYIESVKFHKFIFKVAGNEQLEKIGVRNMEQEAVFSYRSLFQNSGRTSEAHKEHKEILKCIVDKDPDGAEKAAKNHIHILIKKIIMGEDIF
ncbi:GntR family transcriptional regulator [Acidaminococcus sp. DS4831]|uniref:GntR family transcriptional regulator n=1 Tax=Acidaminococcus sp. DS4831 TaxID=3141399 RepID=UPI0032E39B19